jgi:hemoglobin
MKSDIQNKDDIIKLVNLFYERVQKDEILGHIFNEIAKVNWDTHLPKMYSFWDNLLFQTGEYKGRPFPPHVNLNQIFPLTSIQFNQWLVLWHITINELFAGTKTEELKQKSQQIKELWNIRMDMFNAPLNT